MKKLFLIEKVTAELKEQIGKCSKDDHLVLLTPEAVHEFKNHACKIHFPDEFISPQDLNDLGESNFDKIRQLVSTLHTLLINSFPILKDKNINFAHYNIDTFKIDYDTITSRMLILIRAFKSISPDLVYFFKINTSDLSASNRYPPYSLYSLIAENVCSSMNIKFENLFSFNMLEVPINKYRFLKPLKAKLRYLSYFLTRGASRIIFPFNKKSKVLLIDPESNLSSIFKSKTVFSKFLVYFWRRDLGYLNKFFSSPKADSIDDKHNLDITSTWINETIQKIKINNKSLFIYENIDFFSIFKPRIARFFSLLKPHFDLYQNLNNWIKQNRISSSFAHCGISNITDGTLFKILSENNVPYIMFQHGGGAYGLIEHSSFHIRDFELCPNSYYMLWGQGVNEAVEIYAKKHNVRLFNTGSPVIRSIVKKRKISASNKKKQIYHVIQNFREHGNNNYYPAGGGHFTDVWYFNFHLKILDIFKKYDNYDFIIKVPPSFSEKSIYNSLVKDSNNIDICDVPLLKCLDKADLFIIDSLSTSIIQCTATNKPIVVYTGNECKRPRSKAIELLKKRCLCSLNEEEYFKNINKILLESKFDMSDTINDEFLNFYGIGNNLNNPEWSKIFSKHI